MLSGTVDRKRPVLLSKTADFIRRAADKVALVVMDGMSFENLFTIQREFADQDFSWSDADYKQMEKAMRRDYDHVIYGLDGKEFSAQEEDKQKDIFVDEMTIRAILTERQFKRLTLYVIRGMTVEQIAEQEGVAHQNVSKSIRQAKKKIKFFFEKQGAKVPF